MQPSGQKPLRLVIPKSAIRGDSSGSQEAVHTEQNIIESDAKSEHQSSPIAQPVSLYQSPPALILGQCSTGMAPLAVSQKNTSLPGAANGLVSAKYLTRKATQSAYRGLETLSELLPRMGDGERRRALLSYCQRERRTFAKLLGVMEWHPRMADALEAMHATQDLQTERAVRLTRVADRLCVRHYDTFLTSASVRTNIPASIDLLTFGWLPHGLPRSITEGLDESVDKDATIAKLNRLSVSELAKLLVPEDCKIVSISDGRVSIGLLNGEVSLSACLVPRPDFSARWFITGCLVNDSAAEEAIGNALTGMLQVKYNQDGAMQSDWLLAVEQDLLLYRRLYLIHHLFIQFTMCKSKHPLILKVEQSEGSVRVQLYPKAAASPLLLFSLCLEDRVLSWTCSWRQDLVIRESFAIEHLAEDIISDAFNNLSSRMLTLIYEQHRSELNRHHFLFSDNLQLEFSIPWSHFQASVRVSRGSGALECLVNGRSIACNPSDLMVTLKRMAAESVVACVKDGTPTPFTAAEQSRLGASPKLFIHLADDDPESATFMAVCIESQRLTAQVHLLSCGRHAKFRLLWSIKRMRQIGEIDDFGADLLNSLEPMVTKALGPFQFESEMVSAGLEYRLDGLSAVIFNLPLHVGIERIVIGPDMSATITLTDPLPPSQDIQLCATRMDDLVKLISAFSRFCLLAAQGRDGPVGSMSAGDIVVGNRHLQFRDGRVYIDGGEFGGAKLS